MALIQKLGTGTGFLKAGLMGFAKSGKTYTATDLAIGTHKFFGSTGRIVFFDSENGSEYVSERIQQQTGQDLVGVKSRSFADLMELTTELKPHDILIVDSISACWKELQDAHLDRVNQMLKKKNKAPRFSLEFQDWNVIKAKWDEWVRFFLNSQNHIIVCGRAAWAYDFESRDDVQGNEKKELVRSGTKMRAEGEFSFESSLLLEMERITDSGSRRVTKRRATVLGDRFGDLDGKQFINPKFKDFEIHLRRLKPGVHDPIDMDLKTDTGIDEDGDAIFNKERKFRTILCEEIQGLLVYHIPGLSAKEKSEKAALLHSAFQTRSWTQVEQLSSERLKEGLAYLRSVLDDHGQDVSEPAKPADEAVMEEMPEAVPA